MNEGQSKRQEASEARRDNPTERPPGNPTEMPPEMPPERPPEIPPGVPPGLAPATRRPVAARETAAANRCWWDAEADAYQAEHGAFLGGTALEGTGGAAAGAAFIWGPEGLDEAAAHLLGDVRGRRVLEVGAGAAQCSRWLLGQGALAVAVDISHRQLCHSLALDARHGTRVPVAQADAARLPLADACVDDACSAYGAVPFVADAAAVHREVARVLRPGGRWVFSVTHPVRWCFPDDPGPAGLVARDPYFDRTPYVEQDGAGRPTYVEHHRTLGDHVRSIVAADFRLVDVVEPEWPPGHTRSWGGWSPLRGRLIPGTAIFCCRKPS